MIVLKTSILLDIDSISFKEKKEDITVKISCIYLINIPKYDKSYMLFWDENSNKVFGYAFNIKYNKFLSNRMIKSTIYSEYFYIRDIFWDCKTDKELEFKIYSAIKAKFIILLQKVNV